MQSLMASPFPLTIPYSKTNFQKPSSLQIQCKASSSPVIISPPPPNFSFKNEILEISKQAIGKTHPELLDLAENGTLVFIQKSQFGPVPSWRSEFVEPEGIYVIGTTHVSQDSASHVDRVIRALRPENVVVELCRSRAGIMYVTENDDEDKQLRSNMFSLSGNGFFGAVGRSINLGGQSALALRLLLAFFSNKVSSDIKRPFGDEFRAARKVSEEIGAQLVLGDRPIEITLERAWGSLKWKEKMSLVSAVIRGITSSDLSEKTLKESGKRDSNFQLYEQLSFSYPSLLPPLIHERDTFIAWSLKRSKAVNGSKRVVGVIGKGHMNGVIYSLISDQGNLRFKDVAGKRPGSEYGWLGGIAKDLVRDTVIGIILWLVYEQVKLML